MFLRNLFRKKDKTPHCSAVILAAGMSERMHDDKMYMDLDGTPVLVRTLQAFQGSELVDEIVVVTRADKLLETADMCKKYGISKTSKVIRGGSTRTESALIGVSEVKKGVKLIAIHDGARPLISDGLITATVLAGAEHLAAAPVIPNTDTLKAVDGKGFITDTVDRAKTVRIQTPQVFDADMIKGALTKAVGAGMSLTDDCAAVELMGVKTFCVEGDEDNIKITCPRDMMIAQAILRSRGE